MADKKTTIIGRIAVKVLPDLRDFKRDADRKLRKIESQLNSISVKMELDAKDLAKKAQAVVKEAEAKAGDIDVEARVKMNDRIAKEIISRQVKRIQSELDKIKVNPDLDARTIRKKLAELEGKLFQIDDLTLKLTTDLDERSRRETVHKIKKLKDDVEDITAEISVSVQEPRFRKVQARLALLARNRWVKLKPIVDSGAATKAATVLSALSGVRLVGSITGDFWDWIKNLDKNLPKILGLTGVFTGLASAIGASASNAFALAAGLAGLLPLALSIPGILGGLAVGGLVTIVGLADFNKKVPEAKKLWGELRKEISKDFWSTALKPVKELVNDLFPRLRKNFKPVSKEIGDWFGNFAKDIGKALVPALDGMFKNLKDSIGIFKGATKPLAGIVTSFGKMGSEQLPALAKWTKTWIDRFDAFLKRIQKDGTWDRWVETAKQGFEDLGRILGSTFKIIGDIAHVASVSGGAGLGTLADTLERIEKVTSGARFQTGLKNFFEGAHGFFEAFSSGAGKAIGDLFYALSGTFADLAPKIGATFGELIKALATELAKPSSQKAIKDLITGLLDFVKAIIPHVPDIMEFFRTVATAIGDIAKAMGPNVGTMLGELAKLGTAITPEIADAAVKLAPVLADILKTVTDFAKDHPDVAAAAFSLGALLKIFGGGGIVTKLVFKFAWTFVTKPLFWAIGKLFTSILGKFNTGAASTGSKIQWGKLTSGFGSGISGAISKIPFAALFKGIGTKVLGPLGAALLVTDIGSFLKPFADQLVLDIRSMLPAPVAKELGMFWEYVKQQPQFKALTMGSEALLDSIWPDKWPWEDDPPPAPPAPDLGPLGASLTTATKTIFDGVNTTVQTAISPVPGAVQTVIDKAAAALRDSKPAVDGGAATSVSGAVGAIRAGLSGAAGEATGAVAGMAAAMTVGRAVVAIQAAALGRAAVPPVPNMYASGQSIGSTLASGISSMARTVASAASGIMAAARGFFPFSPAKEGPFSGKGWVLYSGISIGQAFADGISSRETVVANAARTLMQAASSEIDSLKIDAPAIVGGKGFEAGLVGGLTQESVTEASINSVVVNVTNNNPVAEKGSTSVNRNMQRLSLAGVI